MSELRRDAKDSLEDLEKELRSIIDQIMTDKKGPGWMNDPINGLTVESISKIKETLEIEQKKKRESSKKVIDYTYIHDLLKIITKNWNLFSSIFGDKKKFEVYMDTIIENRNSLAHPRLLEEHEYHLVIGACKLIIRNIANWKIGAGRRIEKYKCQLIFFNMHKSSNVDLDNEINQWISNLDYRNIKEEGKSSVISFEGGKISISYPSDFTTYSYMTKNRELKTVFCKYVTIESENKMLIARAIEQSKKPFRTFEMILEEKLDLEIVSEKMISSSAKFEFEHSVTGEIGHISYLAYESESFKWPVRYVKFILNNFNDGKSITIFFDGNVDEGLMNLESIHPEIILDYLYNNLKFEEKRNFIKSILFPFNEENTDSIFGDSSDLTFNEIF